MAAGSGDLQCAPRRQLATYIGQVPAFNRASAGFSLCDRQGFAPVQVGADLQQRAGREYMFASQRCFAARGLRYYQPAPGVAGGDGTGQCAGHRPQGSAERQLADKFECLDRFRRHLPGRGEYADGNRQVVAAAVLGQVRGGQVDGNTLVRKYEVTVEQCAAYAVAALAHSSFRQADDMEGRKAIGEVSFNGDERGLHTQLGAREHDG
ncbi:hypothetical protein MNKW57_02770 [Biformimicrobium ophioploci]|uniref:Uncharacterized protein n=1 Tax=Biformimicrobium ophioploci TaxID=3036711 RepID=A0ABQ6LV73_9GAMM|nr:hypothetical protein MNKW57_02770 [Microbulbifer sp. NKW57]